MEIALNWFVPAIAALLFYGLGQGLVKKYIDDVSPARFCLYFVVSKAIVNLTFFATNEHPDPFMAEGRAVLITGIIAYILDGAGWILYFKSIISGPISIVGTLSAAYPATTILFARLFLNEVLSPVQYIGVLLVILGCIGLAWGPSDQKKVKGKIWIFYATSALIIWGASQTLMKHCYSLPNASEGNMALFNTIGGFLTLGVYGFLYGRLKSKSSLSLSDRLKEWSRSFLPMGMMAVGDLGVILAYKSGPASLVTPITAAYPMVTIVFAAFILKEKITKSQVALIALILVGMYLCPGASE
jgi:drug/metabolite transporter (DMT)-like permease